MSSSRDELGARFDGAARIETGQDKPPVEQLLRQVRRVRRRLVLESFVGALAWCWFVALLAAVVVLSAVKLWPWALGRGAELGLVAAAVVLGALVAAAWTWAVGRSLAEAAVEIDRRFGLAERVSSCLALDKAQLASPFGRALVADAAGRVARIDALARFPIHFSRRTLLPLAPAIAALGLATLVAPRHQAQAEAADAGGRIKRPASELARRLAEERKEARDHDLAEAERILGRLEQATVKLTQRPATDPKQAIAELNDLAKEAEQRRRELAGAGELRQQLARLQDLQPGPAAKLARAIKTGDLASAIRDIDSLGEQLAAGQMDPQAQQTLGAQLDRMYTAIDQQAKAQHAGLEGLKKQIEGQRAAGNSRATEELQRQLERGEEKRSQLERLQRMADHLAGAAGHAKSGRARQAAQALSEFGSELSAIEASDRESAMLEDALDQMAQAKRSMACSNCQGQGCKNCEDRSGHLARKGSSAPDDAPGSGQAGRRTHGEDVDAGFFDSQVKQHVGRGPLVIAGPVEGPNRKGQVRQEIQGEFEAAARQPSQPLAEQRLPRAYRDHAKDYFDALRDDAQ